jgi:hypothetical protein
MALLQKGYLGATPLFRNIAWYDAFAPFFLQAASTNVTTAATAHTKGSWSQSFASASGDVSLVALYVFNLATSTANSAALIDIGTGASGSETVVVPNIAVGGASEPNFYLFPLKIASGTRIAVRAQGAQTSKTFRADLTTFSTNDYAIAPTTLDAIGSSTANSQGTSFSGASGTWVEATASTSRAYRAVVLVPSTHDTDIVTGSPTLTVGVGASGSEVEFGIARPNYLNSEACRFNQPYITLFTRNIPAGSRLAVKHTIAADPSKYGFCLIGIP